MQNGTAMIDTLRTALGPMPPDWYAGLAALVGLVLVLPFLACVL